MLLRSVLGVAAVLAIAAPGAAVAKVPAVDPGGMRGLDSANQVIVVAASGTRTTRATARTYERAGDGWRIVRRAMPARLGRNGLSRPSRRHEGDGTTPIGNYGFVYGFGSRADPGVTGLRWRRLGRGDCWSGARRDYNRWAHRTPCRPGEDLWANAGLAYRYAAVIDFNYRRPVVRPRLGDLPPRDEERPDGGLRVAARGRPGVGAALDAAGHAHPDRSDELPGGAQELSSWVQCRAMGREPFDPPPGGGPRRPVDPGGVPVAPDDPGGPAWPERVEDQIRNLKQLLAVVGVLALIAVGVALWALLGEDEDSGSASAERVARLDDRVDQLEKEVGDTSEESDVNRLEKELENKADQDELEKVRDEVEQLSEDVRGSESGDDTAQTVDQLDQRMDELEQQVKDLQDQQEQQP